MIKTATLAITIILLAGCGKEYQTPLLGHPNTPFGSAYNQQLMSQQVNPGPAADTPVTGMDGRLGERVAKGYHSPKSEDTGPGFAEVIETLMKPQ